MPDWLDPKAPTTLRYLKAAGYRTGHFGKWHLGEGGPTMADYGIDDSAVYHGLGPKAPASGNDIPEHAVKFIEANKDHPFYVNVWLHESHLTYSPSDASMERRKHLDPRQQNIPFNRWDTNKDEFLSFDEYKTGQEGEDGLVPRYQAFDKDNDGKVTRKELVGK
jgi:arylsulfatase A-like enzyme